jgi:uncharacterized protein involved in exopolysaccharide biosynthesis
MNLIRPRTLLEYTGPFWRRKRLLLLIVTVFLLSALAAINRVPDVYQSEALIVIAGEQSEEARQAGVARINTITQQMLSRTNLLPLIRRYGLYGAESDPDVAIEHMRRSIQVDVRRRGYYPEIPEAVAVTYRSVNPEIARAVLTDLISIFEKSNDDLRRQAAEEKSRVNEKLSEVEGQIRKLGRGGRGTREVTDQNYVRARQLEINSSVAAYGDRQFALQRQMEDLQKQIEEQQRLARMATTGNGSAGSLLVRKAELEAQLRDYKTQYTDKNPKVIQSRTQLEEINKQIAQLNNSQGDGLANSPEARELRSLQRELRRAETEMEVTRREMERRRQSASTAAIGAPRITVGPPAASFSSGAETGFLFSRYSSLIEKQDYIQRLEGASGLAPAPFQIVDTPDLPQLPVGPNRIKLYLIAIIMALGLALLALAAIEAPRLRLLNDNRDIAYSVGAPVVALIPEALTPDERGRARRVRLIRRGAVLLAVGLFVPTLVLALHGLKFFEFLAFR